jgi:excisionase family DNA binding protein
LELIFQRIHPDDRDVVQQTIDRAAEGRTNLDFEHRLFMPDGSVKYLHILARALETSSGDLEYVGAVHDVTERTRSEDTLRQTQANLARISRVTTMGELTAALAHEIKQPIAAAVTDAKTCLRWLGRDQPDLAEAREAASRVVKDATRAADIISRVRLLFEKGTTQRELLDVNEVIREMIVLLRGEANRYSISIGTELAEDLPKVMADRVHLQHLKAGELAKLLGVTRQHIYKMAAASAIPSFRIGAAVRFDPKQVAEWLTRRMPQTVTPSSPSRLAV